MLLNKPNFIVDNRKSRASDGMSFSQTYEIVHPRPQQGKYSF